MKEGGMALPINWYRAKGWLDWGMVLLKPVVGCVVIYEREGGGHVGLIVGCDLKGNLMTLGGNQGNRVSIMPFDKTRAIGFRWPSGYGLIPVDPLPIVNSDGIVSVLEV
jgi:uncharacterized protein (TIGR02594 family)